MLEEIRNLIEQIDNTNNFYDVAVSKELVEEVITETGYRKLVAELVNNKLFLEKRFKKSTHIEDCYNKVKTTNGTLQIYYALEYVSLMNPVTETTISKIIERACS